MIPVGVDLAEPRTATERWAAIPIRWRAVLIVAGAFIVIQLGLSFLDGIVGGAPAGSGPSSAFGTGPSGVAALAQLLEQYGHPVDRSTRPVSSTVLPSGSTLFVVDPSGWTGADTAAVRRLFGSGGHVVLAGIPPDSALLAVLFGTDDVPRWQNLSSGPAHAVGSTPAVNGVVVVTSGAVGSIASAGSSTTILAGARRIFAVSNETSTSERPRAVFLASSNPLTNAALADRDNAAFALNLVGPASAPVTFDEFDHGYGRTGGGLAGLPAWWRWGLGMALAAMIIWVISAARRFGPVEATSLPLTPARLKYADAMAAVLAALPEDRLADTVKPLRTEARMLLCRRSGTPVAAPDVDVLAAATRARVPEFVVATVLEQPGGALGAIGLGRALAWLESHTGGRG